MKEKIDLIVETDNMVIFSPDHAHAYSAEIAPTDAKMSFDFEGVPVRDILDQIEPDDVVAFFDAEELLDAMDTSTIADYLENHGFRID